MFRRHTRRRPAARTRLSYANVAASAALFIALGGTATAAVTLPRDSVGSPQIRADAVRSPELQKDAVRSPEIKAESVRTSEIEDEGIRLADISAGARSALEGAQGPAGPQGPPGASSLRFDEVDLVNVSACDRLVDCSSLASVSLPPGSWLVQAKFTVVGSPFGFVDSCGLVQGEPFDPEVVDEAGSIGLNVDTGSEDVALTTVAQTTGVLTSVVLRCTEDSDAFLSARDVKLTALEVDSAVGF